MKRTRVMRLGFAVSCWLVAAAAHGQEAVAFEPYLGMKDQFEIGLPAGCSVYDQAVVIGKPGKTGPPVIFSAETIDATAMMSGDKEALRKVLGQLASVEVGSIASFALDRLRADRGMSCKGFDARAQKKTLDLISTDPMFGRGRVTREKPQAEPMAVGGCQGLRLKGKGTASTGAGKTLDIVAVSDGEVLFLFKLLNLDAHYPTNVAIFEKAISTLRMASATATSK